MVLATRTRMTTTGEYNEGDKFGGNAVMVVLTDSLLLAWGFDTGGVRPRAGKWNAGFGATMWHEEVHLGR